MSKDAPDILVFPPLISVAVPLAAIVLEWVVPLRWLPGPGQPVTAVLGLSVLVAAAALPITAARAFKRAGTNVDPRRPALKIVRDGPFQFTRNPMYLGMVLLQLGLALTFSLDWALIGAGVVWVALHFGVVLREEAYLTTKFGSDYTDYLESSRRWL